MTTDQTVIEAVSSGAPAPSRPARKREKSRLGGIGRYVATRIALIVPSAFFAATITFFLVNLVPSDPVRALLGDMATPEAIAAKKAELGLDQSLLARYGDYLLGLLHGDLGTSYQSSNSVLSEILGRLPSTLVVTVPALVLGALLGVLLGVRVASAKRPGAVRGVVTVLQSMPAFVVGVLGILLLVTTVPLLPPPTGQLDISLVRPPDVTGAVVIDALLAGDVPAFSNAAAHLVLPVASLALVLAVPFARITASAVSSNLAAEYSGFGTGNGLTRRTVVANARRSARSSIVVVTGIVTAEVVGGAVIIERLFAWNGLGAWSLNSILLKDLPAIQGFVLFSTITTIVVFLVADVIGSLLDPRFR